MVYAVQVTSVEESLSDYYSQVNKTVNLFADAYEWRNVPVAAAVAANKCGHALQHSAAYPTIMLRSKIVPAVQISSNLSQWIIIAGLSFMGFGGNATILLIVVILFAVTTLFSFITQPIEFKASQGRLMVQILSPHRIMQNQKIP